MAESLISFGTILWVHPMRLTLPSNGGLGSFFSARVVSTRLNCSDGSLFKKAMESQQKTAADLMERMKGDSEKVTSISQSFMQDSQKMAEETTKKAVETAKQ